MLVHAETIEIEVTMGSDAAREFLRGAGLSAREVARMTRANDSSNGIELPLSVASRLFEVRAGAEPVEAKSCMGVPGESESIFVSTYPRPKTDSVFVRATYFAGIEYMHTGPFAAGDDQRRELATALLSPSSPPLKVPLAVSAGAASSGETASAPRPSFIEFLRLGVVHILTGFDHLLFLCALLAGVRKVRPMLIIITCFTLGHSLTLGLAALDVITLSPRVVEPLIALSILLVGIENFVRPDATSDRYGMAAGFGLIHGFGFAGALRDTGLGHSAASILMPLLSFNLGVEAGQLLVAGLVVPLLLVLRKKTGFERYGAPSLSILVILVSGYWLVERTLFFR